MLMIEAALAFRYPLGLETVVSAEVLLPSSTGYPDLCRGRGLHQEFLLECFLTAQYCHDHDLLEH